MVDRRSEEPSFAPRRPLAGGAEGAGATPSGAPPASAPLTDRINQAYASSTPIAPDEPERGTSPPSPTAAQFAAAMAAARTDPPRQPASVATVTRRPRRARLRLTHVDPWSVMKVAFLLSVAIGIVMVVAVAVLWSVLNASGVWTSIDKTVREVVGTDSSTRFHIEDYVGTSRVMGFTMLVAAVDVVLMTVIATLGAFLYNLAAALLGGLEVVL